MKWIPIRLRFSSRVLRIFSCLFTRLLSSFRSFLAFLSRSFSFLAVRTVLFLVLLPCLVRADATQDAILHNLEVIVEILNYGYSTAETQSAITWPVDEDMEPYSSWLKPSLYDPSGAAYLYSILQAVRSLTNSPALPDLSSIESDLSSVVSSLVSIDSNTDIDEQLASLLNSLLMSESYLETINYSASSLPDLLNAKSYSSSMWHTHVDEDQITDLVNAIGDLSFDFDTAIENLIYQIQQNGADISGQLYPAMSNGLSSLVVNMGDIINALTNIQDMANDMRDGLGYDGTSRSVQLDFGYASQSDSSRSLARDLRYLQQQFGFENPSPSNNLAFLLRSVFDPSAAQSVVSSMSNEVASVSLKGSEVQSESDTLASNTVAVAQSEEPDWEENRFTGDNPIEESSSSLESAAQNIISRMTPSLPESTSSDKEIVLFRGAFPILGGRPSTRSSSVNLNIAYPLVDYDEVSSGLNIMRSIMEVVWSFISVLICGSFLLRFWAHSAKIASGIASGHFEESGSLDGWL